MQGQKKLARVSAGVKEFVSLVAIVAVTSVLAGLYTLPGTRIPLVNPVPAVCLTALLVFGIRAWPAVLAGSAVWSMVALWPDLALVSSYTVAVTIASVLAAWGILRFWRMDLTRHAVHNLMVFYLFGALVFTGVMIPVMSPVITLTLELDWAAALVLTSWLIPYVILSVATFLPVVMLLVLRLPTGPTVAGAPHVFVRLSRGAWTAIAILLALGHLWLLAAGRSDLAASVRVVLLFMLIIAALRFDYRFLSVVIAATVIYLLVSEPIWLGVRQSGLQVSYILDLTVVIVVVVLAAQLIAMFRLQGVAAMADMRRQASHDPATGLLNREALRRRLAEANRQGDGSGVGHACLHIDVDRFAVINDACGVEAGDALLREIADHVTGGLPVTAAAARLDGDDFAVLLRNCPEQEAQRLAQETCSRVAGYRFASADQEHRVTVSIGVVPFAAGIADSDLLLLTAHTAMELAQAGGGDGVRVLRVGDDAVAERQRASALVSQIRAAMEANRFEIYCQELQPLQEDGGAGLSFEVLTRLVDRDGKPLPPVEIFPVAEKNELMCAIDRIVVGNTVRWLAAHPACLQRTANCCVNLSGASIIVDNVAFFRELLESYAIPPDKICFEVTETAAVTHFAAAVEFIGALKKLGCRFALDDFGTGLSSFEYFRELPVDKIKIDGAFIRGLERGSRNYAIVQAVVSMARAFSLQTVAEFVENDQVRDLLRDLGVTYAQGHVVRKPLPIDEFFAASH